MMEKKCYRTHETLFLRKKKDMDAWYFNAQVALFQVVLNVPLAAPVALFEGISLRDIPTSLVDGFNCYARGIGSTTCLIEDVVCQFCNVVVVCMILPSSDCVYVCRTVSQKTAVEHSGP